jgi:glycosyltransferase involved in cell wall biosynthesis
VVCLSVSHINDFRNLTYKKIFVVNNGIKLSKFSVRLSYSSIGEKVKILFLSNYVISKGVIFFIDTLAELKKQTLNFEAIMVGADGDITKDDLERYISEAKMNHFIKVMGKVDNESKKFDYFTWADIFFFPTYYPNEVFPGVVLEAMQSGCAVVSTTTGVIPDIIESNVDGLIGANSDIASFADMIAKLIHEPAEIKRLGEQAQISFKEKFTMEIFEENMHKVFNQIL